MINKKNAGIYVRVSTKMQVQDGYSIAAQKENLINFAKNNNFEIYDIYADEGISGKNVNRPEIQRLIGDIKSKKIDIVLFQQFDRLTRSLSDTESLIDLFKDYDIDIWSINEGGILDTTSSSGRFMTLLKGLFGQHERELTAERIKIALKRKAHEGYTLCAGCPPYGYERIKGNKILHIKENESKVVKNIFEKFISGMNFTQIAKELNFEKIPTKKSEKTINNKKTLGIWTAKSVKLILTNPVYIGKIRYHVSQKDLYIGNGKHKGIIDKKLWELTQKKISITKTKSKTKKANSDAYFCGTIHCGICHRKMTSARTCKNGKVYSSYRCINRENQICSAKYISHNKVEKAFVSFLNDNIEKLNISNNFSINFKNNNKKEKLLKINEKKLKQKEIRDLFLYEKISFKEYKYMNDELEKIIKNYKEQINCKIINNVDINKISKKFGDHWTYLNNLEKQKFLNEFVKKIFVSNENKQKDATIIEIEFYD